MSWACLVSPHYGLVFKWLGKNKGRGRDFRGGSRGGSSGRTNEQRNYGDSKWNEQTSENSQRGGLNRGRGSNNGSRGRNGNNSSRGSHFSNMKSYNCGKLGHPAYRCPKKASTSSHGQEKINYIQEENNSKAGEVDLDVEKGENLMLRRVLVKDPVKEEPKQWRALFRTTSKILGKV